MKDLDTIIQPFLPAVLPVLVQVSIPPEQIDTRHRPPCPGDFSHCREAVQPKKSVEISQVGFQRLIPVFTVHTGNGVEEPNVDRHR